MAQLRQSMNLSQSLRMTPQLQQAIKMLQLSRMEMETAVRAELEENPILEETQDLREDDLQRTKEAADSVAGESREAAEDQSAGHDADPQKQDEFEWESYLESQNKPAPQSHGGNEEIMNYENVITTTTSLHEHLLWQARMYGFNEEEFKIASILIDYIDDDGYLLTPLQTIADDEQVPVQEFEDILKFIHEFDPAGVGARNMQECLLLQAKFLEEDTNDLVQLITHHIKDLEKKAYDKIATAMGKSIAEVGELCKIIYAMEPKPGRAFSPEDTHYVSPDVYVYKVGDDYTVSLNEEGLPRLKISNFYKNMLKDSKKDEKAYSYIQEKLRSAVWLIKSIHQRQKTIFRVTESIVKRQREFLDKGSSFIKPMVLRDVAGDIGMHESTVSRVTTSKYVHTPQGIYELKYFFNSGINTSDGESLASESVKLKIKELIAKEDNKHPLSDQDIVDKLDKEGIQIARRTVAKYRDVLKILPSSKRKKFF